MSSLPHRELRLEVSSLTSNEAQELLKKADDLKAAQERRKAYWSNVMQEEATFEKWSSNELMEAITDYCEAEGKPLVVDDGNRDVFKLLCQYFTSDPEFENGTQYSLNKGIYLFGGIGVGKSHLMRLMRSNQRQAYRIVDCSDIAAEFIKKDGGETSLEKYFRDTPLLYKNRYNHAVCGYCFDDFGIESEGRYFGNQVNVMERIIEVRYRSTTPLITHMVSNISGKQVADRYGARIADRMHEMFNVVEFPTTAKSRR